MLIEVAKKNFKLEKNSLRVQTMNFLDELISKHFLQENVIPLVLIGFCFAFETKKKLYRGHKLAVSEISNFISVRNWATT